ncbi:MAG: 5'-methylthioadenosine/S-adenosylhomocysteine nucleosidase [Nitrospinae bacterium]|nr:5'-methylthioadenosine/S-adenosylhomocysteine nucleosidase [Nitrospinota bacterium]
MEPLVHTFDERGYTARSCQIGHMKCVEIPSLKLLVAVGGHGKAQFAVQSQYLIDRCPDASALICVGAAGRLAHHLTCGDVVVATSTIEHDYRLRFISRPPPVHQPDPALLATLREVSASRSFRFRVHFGIVASGDEDIIDPVRAEEVRLATGALAVAWEGSGGARAAHFNGLDFMEVRVITDAAGEAAAHEFHENLKMVMPNATELLLEWASRGGSGEGAGIATAPSPKNCACNVRRTQLKH